MTNIVFSRLLKLYRIHLKRKQMKVMYKIPCILVKVAYNFYVFKVHKVFYKQLKYIPLISRYK